MKKLTLGLASLCLCLSVTARAEDKFERIRLVAQRVEQTFGQGSPLARTMYLVALGPAQRETLFYAPFSTSFFFEESNHLSDAEKDGTRLALLEKLSAISQTPFSIISFNKLENKANLDPERMQELFVDRLAEILSRQNGRPIHIAFLLADIETSPGSLALLRLIYRIIYDVRVRGKRDVHSLENVDFIFFAAAPKMNESITQLSRSELEKMMLERLKIPPSLIARLNTITPIHLDRCESSLNSYATSPNHSDF